MVALRVRRDWRAGSVWTADYPLPYTPQEEIQEERAVKPDKRGRKVAQEFNGRLIGYARVSTKDQVMDMQLDALNKAGCVMIFQEKASGTDRDRPELAKCLAECQRGDIFVVYKIDRAARNLRHMLDIFDDCKNRGVGIRSLSEVIDTSTPHGNLVNGVIGLVAQFFAELNSERTRDGIAAYRARNRDGAWGPTPKLSPDQLSDAVAALDDGVPFAELEGARE
jgi:DNA invertase Pin-like site-specific DNA recombinase